MPLSDFDAASFWPAIKQFVIDAGIEPISLGEGEAEVQGKIFAAMAAKGTPLSLGMEPGEIRRALAASIAGGGAPPWATGADSYFDFISETPSGLTDTHAQTIYADDNAGALSAFTANQIVKTNRGLQTVRTYTQYAANPTAPANQTTASLPIGTYTLWIEGPGSVTVAANTAVGAGFGAALDGTNVTFTISTAGTVNLTVAGAPTLVQLIDKSFVQPPIYSALSVTGNRQVFTSGLSLAAGVRGWASFFVRDPGYDFANLLRFYDTATSGNRFSLFHSSGTIVASLATATVAQGSVSLGPWQTGLTTIAFAAGPNFFTGRIVGQSNPTPDVVATFGDMDRMSLGGAGAAATSNTFLNTMASALWFGQPDASNFAEVFAKAQLAHSHLSVFSDEFSEEFT